MTGENDEYNHSKATYLYPPFSYIPRSAKNYKIAPALTDIDAILSDIRDAHKSDITTADDTTIAEKLKRDIEAAATFKDSSLEQQFRIYCNQLGIPYDKLTPEELNGVMSALKKSKYLRCGQNRRGKSLPLHRKN